MTKEKFQHLGTQIDAEAIKNMPVHLLYEDRIPETKDHFEKIKEENFSDPDIVAAVDNIICKIDNIIHLGNSKKITGEIMKSANDDNYSNKLAA